LGQPSETKPTLGATGGAAKEAFDMIKTDVRL
jgi:hypothetical protein